MTSRFVTIDLADVPPPPIIDPLDFEAIRTAFLADAVARLNAAGITYNVQSLESDPLVKIAEAWATRELLMRARINDAARAVLLASSWSTNIDTIGAAFDTPRLPNETDDAYKARIHLAPEAFSNSGPAGGYEYFALTQLSGLRDATAVMTKPGYVRVTLMYPPPVFSPTQDQINQLALFYQGTDAKPLTDIVSVTGPEIVDVPIVATLILYPGPDKAVVTAAAARALNAFLVKNQKLGFTIACSEISAQLQQPGVKSVLLTSPASDVVLGPTQTYKIPSTSITPANFREA